MASGKIPSDRQAINESRIEQHREASQGSHCEHPPTKVTIKEVKPDDAAKELLSQMTKEKEVFIKFDWDEANKQPLILELQIAAKSFEKKGTYTITVAILPGNVIENLKVELRELFENTQCVKVMFNPRKDFTNLLHLGIHIKNLFDIQTCVQCIHSNGRVKDSAMTLDKICEKFGINQTEYQCQDSTDVSTLYVLIQLYTRFRSKDGEWFRATNQMKYMYKQKMARIIHLTRTQSINIHSRVTNATVMSPNQDEINLRDNYNSNRQTLLTYGRQIQDVHNSYSLIHTARFTGNYNTHAQVMDNYHRTLNGNYRRNPQHRQNGNTHKQRYRDYR